MKTFIEFLSEDAVKAQQAWQDWMKANPQEFSKGGRFYERGSSEKTTAAAKDFMKSYMKTGKPPAGFEVKRTKVSGQDVRSGSQTRTQTPPKQPTGTPQTGTQASTQTPPKQPKASTPPPPKTEPKAAPPKQPTGTSQTPPRGAQTSPSSTPPPRNTQASSAPPRSSGGLSTAAKPPTAAPKGPGLRSRLGSVVGPAANVATAAMDYKERRDAGQSRQRAAGGALSSLAGYAKGAEYGAKLGARVPLPLPIWAKAGGGALLGGALGSAGAQTAYDYAADKSRPARQAISKATGFDKFQQKNELIKNAKPGGGLSNVARAQQTVDTRGARQVAAKTGTYGTRQGSALTGIGGKTTTSKDAKGNAFMSTGAGSQRKTVQLAKTQLVRDPKSGKQVVGDLAFKGGKATYLARPSVASRDTSLSARVGRALNIGRYSKAAETQAAKQEYRTALKNTQTYQKKLGITSKAATAQKLPGRGVGPAKVGPKLVGPKIVGPKKVGTGAKPSATVKPA
jgi:hypothetical protein